MFRLQSQCLSATKRKGLFSNYYTCGLRAIGLPANISSGRDASTLSDSVAVDNRDGKSTEEYQESSSKTNPESLSSNAVEHGGNEPAVKEYFDKKLRDLLSMAPSEDCVARIRTEFDIARASFQNIPTSLQSMPRMDPNGIYANNNLRMDKIEVYGFDYDYTVAHYTNSLQTLIYDLAKEYLVNENRYPESCARFKYDPDFPIRGLWYDKTNGCLLKLDFFHNIEPDGCYFGRRKMSREEVQNMYGNQHISREYAPNLVGLMDLFCFSEACLISDIIQHFVDEKVDFDACYVFEDVRQAISYVHRSGLVHKKILAQPEKFLEKNVAILSFLRILRDSGKKVFMLTNSPYYFVDGGMRYMFEDFGIRGELWMDLFDVVIALADKPNFYTSDRPFRCYDPERDVVTLAKVNSFNRRTVYCHGCLKSFLEITKWKGPEVIYFGDHLFSDLRGPSKAGWRTAAIIKELEREIAIQNTDKYRLQQAKFHIVQGFLGRFHSLLADNKAGNASNALLEILNEEQAKCRHEMKAMFNSHFGSTFLTDTGRESAFAYNIQRYADVYTSKLENFMKCSSNAWLFPPYDVKIMPHHVKIPSSVFNVPGDQKS